MAGCTTNATPAPAGDPTATPGAILETEVAVVTEQPTAVTEQPTAVTEQPTAVTGKTVSAGMQTDFFDPYTIIVLEGWSDSRKSDPSAPFDALTISKGQNSILIGQGGGDGLTCLFGGVPTPTGEAHLWLEFEGGITIPNPSVDLMRGTTDGITHTVCEKQTEDYITWTSFGSIIYTTPVPDAAALAEMDAMVGSLRVAE
jgi:hypothetical protein